MQRENIYSPDVIIFQTKSHWFCFLPWLAVTLFLIVVIMSISIVSILNDSLASFSGAFYVFLFAAIGIFVCVFETICRIIYYITAEFSISSDGILLIRGRFFGKIIEDIPMSDIIAVNLLSYNKEFDCGTVVILTSSGRGYKLIGIKSPAALIDQVTQSSPRKIL